MRQWWNRRRISPESRFTVQRVSQSYASVLMELLRGRTFWSSSYIQVNTPLDDTGPPSTPPSCLCTPRRRGPCCFVLPLFSSRQIVNGIKLEGLLGVITAALISRWRCLAVSCPEDRVPQHLVGCVGTLDGQC